MLVLLEFKTHHYIIEYTKQAIYCPKCGSKGVWVEEGEGDYYLGEDHRCPSCELKFNLIMGESFNDSIIEQLKTGTTYTPKTPKGR